MILNHPTNVSCPRGVWEMTDRGRTMLKESK